MENDEQVKRHRGRPRREEQRVITEEQRRQEIKEYMRDYMRNYWKNNPDKISKRNETKNQIKAKKMNMLNFDENEYKDVSKEILNLKKLSNDILQKNPQAIIIFIENEILPNI